MEEKAPKLVKKSEIYNMFESLKKDLFRVEEDLTKEILIHNMLRIKELVKDIEEEYQEELVIPDEFNVYIPKLKE